MQCCILGIKISWTQCIILFKNCWIQLIKFYQDIFCLYLWDLLVCNFRFWNVFSDTKLKNANENDNFQLPSESYKKQVASHSWCQDLVSWISADRMCSLPRMCPGCYQGGNGHLVLLQLVTPWIGGICSFWKLAHNITKLLIMNENASWATCGKWESKEKSNITPLRARVELWPFFTQ